MSYLFCLFKTVVFVVVQLLSCVWLFATSWTEALRLFSTVSQSLIKFRSIESVMPSNHFILCFTLLFLPSIFPSIRLFSKASALRIRWPKYWSFSISPSNEYSGLISCRIDFYVKVFYNLKQRRPTLCQSFSITLNHSLSPYLILLLPDVIFGEGNGKSLQCSCLENSMDSIVHGVAKNS